MNLIYKSKNKIENSKRPFDTFGEIRGKNNKGSFLGKWGFSDHYKNYLKNCNR